MALCLYIDKFYEDGFIFLKNGAFVLNMTVDWLLDNSVVVKTFCF